MEAGIYYSWVLLLALVLVAGWVATLVSLPGNWGNVGAAALFAAFVEPPDEGEGIGWTTVGVLIGIAVVGEVIESVAGAAGTAKQGGSRRSMGLSIVGAVLGSIAGVALGLPVPVLGPPIAAILGGALGSFAGAVAGEYWKGRNLEHQWTIGRAAFFGRILGTVGKLIAGAVLVVVALADAMLT